MLLWIRKVKLLFNVLLLAKTSTSIHFPILNTEKQILTFD